MNGSHINLPSITYDVTPEVVYIEPLWKTVSHLDVRLPHKSRNPAPSPPKRDCAGNYLYYLCVSSAFLLISSAHLSQSGKICWKMEEMSGWGVVCHVPNLNQFDSVKDGARIAEMTSLPTKR